MTPFAIEISKNIGRFLGNKVHKDELTSLENLSNALIEYLKQIYQYTAISMYHNVDNSIIIFKQADEINVPGVENRPDAYVPCYLIVKNDDAHNIEEIFWQKLHELEEFRTSYNNIDDGFVFLVTSQKEMWEAQFGLREGNDEYSLKGTQYGKMTLYPQTARGEVQYAPCQMIWLPTKCSGYRFLMAVHDEAFNIPEEYDCLLNRDENNARAYEITEDFEILEFPNDNQEEPNNAYEKFKFMLVKGRFVAAHNTILDWENEILNDYSRLIMSPAFRRLKDKTQVFSLEESDFARVRLTHSLEVAHVARLLGNGIVSKLKEHIEDIHDLYIPDILMVAGLIHDIGNPPFGHFGERTIRKFYREDIKNIPEIRDQFYNLSEQEQNDFKYFDGNVQGFRILRHLGLASDCNSFNINKVILSTLIKYPYSSTEGNDSDSEDHRKHKFGYYAAEKDAYKNICKTLHLEEGQRHPLTYLLEAADDIIYMGDDIEDGWKLGYISTYHIVECFRKVFTNNDVREIFNDDKEDILCRLNEADDVIVAHTIQNMRISLQRYMLNKCIDNFTNEETFEKIINNHLEGNKHEILLYDEITCKIKQFWNELVQNCYDQIHRTQLQGGKAIETLLSIFLDVVFSEKLTDHKSLDIDKNKDANSQRRQAIRLNNDDEVGMIYEIISDNYRKELSPLGHVAPQDAYSKFLLVTDYIAGMTDNFAINLYNELKK